MRFSSHFAYVAAAAAVTTWTLTAAAQTKPAGAATTTAQHEEGEHHHADAAALKNPVKATPESIAAGKAIYDKQCANCHGDTGKGDGKLAASIATGPKPSDFTDASWKHGSTDGEIYTLIHDGSKGTGMRGYGARMKPEEIWNVVNYLKTLAPKTPAKR
jgi:mono/diheme cytochrome c family protein